MVTETEVLFLESETEQEVLAVASPVIEPFKVCAGLAEEFKLHLLEFAYTENEVSGSDLVTEGLAHLCNAEGDLLAGSSLDVCEVYEDTLSGLRTEIELGLAVLGNALESLEHKVELTDIGEILLAAVGAYDIVLLDVVHHLLIGPAGNVCAVEILNEIVSTVTSLALLAVHERIREAADMTGSHPCLGIHENSGVKTNVVLVLLNELLQPCVLDVVLQQNAQRTVIPCICKASVDLGAGVYIAL